MSTDLCELHIDNGNPEDSSDTKDYELLSLNEVRKILRIGYNNLKMIIEEGKLKATRINTRYKISKQSLKRYINSISHYAEKDFKIDDSAIITKINETSVNNIIENLKSKYSKI